MKFRHILLVLFITRLIDVVVIYLSRSFITFHPTFTYEYSSNSVLPTVLNVLGNFDGVHYTHIAQENYAQYEQAFFPLYPILIKLLYPICGSYLISGIIISNFIFIIALWFVFLLLGIVPTVFLVLFPTSFFFNSVYTESLFLFFAMLVFYLLRKNKLLLAAVCSYFAGLTRLSGVFLVIPLFTSLLTHPNTKEIQKYEFIDSLKLLKEQLVNSLNALLKTNIYKLLIVLLPILGLITYSAYLWYTTGDPLFYFHAQPAFGANRSTNIIFLPQVYFRYIKIFVTATRNYDYFVAMVEFIIFTLVITMLIVDLFKVLSIKSVKVKFFRLGLSLFSFANLIVPTLTGTLSSTPRYALLSLSFFIALAEIKNRGIQVLFGVLFLILHIILLAYFAQGYFVS